MKIPSWFRVTPAAVLLVASAAWANAAECDPETQEAPHWGVKNGQCLRSCGALGGTHAFGDRCENHGGVSAGISYDVAFCCKKAEASAPAPSSEPGGGRPLDLPPLTPLGPAMPGWDSCKWKDLTHQNPKYVVGRIISRFPHTTLGLLGAYQYIKRSYPGAKILPGKGDMLHIPCVGKVDLVVNAGGPGGGTAWAWGGYDPSWNECGKRQNGCPNEDLCEKYASKKCDGGRAGPGGGPNDLGPGTGAPAPVPAPPAPVPVPPTTPPPGGGGANGGCRIPNVTAILNEVRGRPGMDEAFHHLCRNNTDWTYLDAAVDELRKTDGRWGYWCRRGNCNDPSHDVLAYYCGEGNRREGSTNASGVDFIIASCYDSSADGNPSIGWGDTFGSSGQPAWTGRRRF